MVGAVVEQQAPSFDLWLAVLAGERVWTDEGDVPSVRARAGASVEILALAFAVTLLWTIAVDRAHRVEDGEVIWIGAGGATLASAVIAVDLLAVATGRPAGVGRFAPRVVWRGGAFLTVLLGVVTVLPPWRGSGAVPLGVVVGADACLTTWALGIDIRPVHWWRRFLVSPLHLGVLGALTAILVLRSSSSTTWSIIGLYTALCLAVAIAGATMFVLDRLSKAMVDERDDERRRVVDAERRHRVHWLHDDVLSEIRLTTLRLQSGDRGADAVAEELQDLDHRLRMRQLDELLAGGSARLADIIQPHVRRAQALGVEISEVPSLDAAGLVVDVPTGRLFGRAVSGLVSNALNAGASKLAIRLGVDAGAIVLEISDDAGGFELSGAPAGRGLDQLAGDLGRGSVVRVAVEGGSIMRVRLPLDQVTDRRTDGVHPRG